MMDWKLGAGEGRRSTLAVRDTYSGYIGRILSRNNMIDSLARFSFKVTVNSLVNTRTIGHLKGAGCSECVRAGSRHTDLAQKDESGAIRFVGQAQTSLGFL